MGIQVSVRCTCYEDGKAAPPPVPVRVDEHDEICAVDPAAHGALLDWRRSGCEHPWMGVVERSLGWGWVRSFRDALEDSGGADQYPVLLANLPEWNGAFYVSPTESAAALDELRRFVESVEVVDEDRLVTGDGAEVGWKAVRGHPEWWQTAAPDLLGLTGRGSLALWSGADLGARPVFEAARVEQRVLGRDADGKADTVELTDVDTGTTCQLKGGIAVDGEHPDRLEVHTHRIDAHQAHPPLGVFEELFTASVGTGHHAVLG
ncbi:hypothetical protein ACFVH6_37445 [Spirillospora sp. NPDC127200]